MNFLKNNIVSLKTNNAPTNGNQGVKGQTNAFQQLFLRTTDISKQNSLPQTMTVDKLINMVQNNKIEVFINHDNKMLNVTEFFKSNQSVGEFIGKQKAEGGIRNVGLGIRNSELGIRN